MRKLSKILVLAGGVALAAGAAATPAAALSFSLFGEPTYCNYYDPYYCPDYGYYGYGAPYGFWRGHRFGGHPFGGHHFAGHSGHFGGHGGHIGGHHR